MILENVVASLVEFMYSQQERIFTPVRPGCLRRGGDRFRRIPWNHLPQANLHLSNLRVIQQKELPELFWKPGTLGDGKPGDRRAVSSSLSFSSRGYPK